jgi:hypothetical protein
MRQGGISSNPKNSNKTLFEMRRAQRMHGQKIPGWIWLAAVSRLYFRLFLWQILGERAARKILDLGRRLLGQQPIWTRT